MILKSQHTLATPSYFISSIKVKLYYRRRIELDASVPSCRIESSENSVQSWHRRVVFFRHLISLLARASTSGGEVQRSVRCADYRRADCTFRAR